MKIKLTKEIFFAISIVVFLAASLTIYTIFYAPLLKELRTKYLKCRPIENEVLEARNLIKLAGKVYGERVLLPEENASQTIDELTRFGKLKNINFISINPGEIEETSKLYKILPVKIKMESSYRELGEFLGSIDDLKKGVVKVKSFKVIADIKDPSKLTLDLVVDIYLSKRSLIK